MNLLLSVTQPGSGDDALRLIVSLLTSVGFAALAHAGCAFIASGSIFSNNACHLRKVARRAQQCQALANVRRVLLRKFTSSKAAWPLQKSGKFCNILDLCWPFLIPKCAKPLIFARSFAPMVVGMAVAPSKSRNQVPIRLVQSVLVLLTQFISGGYAR